MIDRTVTPITRFAFAILLGIAACTPQREPGPGQTAETSSAPAAASQIVYVDVRTPEEFASGHVAGAINIPHDQVEARWNELAAHKDKHVVVYCRTGWRSGLAIDVLRPRGFSRLENGGGLDQLAARGVPTEQ